MIFCGSIFSLFVKTRTSPMFLPKKIRELCFFFVNVESLCIKTK